MSNTACHPATIMPTAPISQTPPDCAFSLYYFGKYGEGQEEASGPTLSIALTDILSSVAVDQAHVRAVFGARRMPKRGRSYGSFQVIFPEREERPTDGYAEWSVRKSVGFDDAIEIFDASVEFDSAEGVLRFRAQELGDDPEALGIIHEGVQKYVKAFDDLLLWDPEADTDIKKGLDDLFQGRDWTPFTSPADLQMPVVTISNVQLVPYDDKLWLAKFDYVNGTESGREMEYVWQLSGGRQVVRHAYSALRSAAPAFNGRQLSQVHNALQAAIDALPDLP